jgi:hypothetical protein
MRRRFILIAGAVLMLAPLSLFADPVTGELAFTGTVMATLTSLNFCTITSCTTGSGTITVDGMTSTGTFAGLGGDTGTITDINSTTTPPGSTVSLANFVTVPAASATFTLTELDPGTGGACPPVGSATCTPPGTATIFENTATGSSAEFSVNATAALTSALGQTTDYTGTFSATFNGESVADVLSMLAGGGSITTPFSATFTPVPTTTTVPEPDTASLIGLGVILLGAGVGVRRFSHC